MLKFIGFGLIFLAFIMILPANSNTQSDLPKMYGIATIVLKDSTGNILFENVIHNQVVNTGTAYMLDQTFRDLATTDVSDADQVDTICVTNANPPAGATDDNQDADAFNTENTIVGNTCKGGITFVTGVTLGQTTAVSPVQTFLAGGTNFPDGTTIRGIGVCGDNGALSPFLFPDCSTAADAPLLAVFDTTDVLVNTGESVDITYTLTLD